MRMRVAFVCGRSIHCRRCAQLALGLPTDGFERLIVSQVGQAPGGEIFALVGAAHSRWPCDAVVFHGCDLGSLGTILHLARMWVPQRTVVDLDRWETPPPRVHRTLGWALPQADGVTASTAGIARMVGRYRPDVGVVADGLDLAGVLYALEQPLPKETQDL